MADIHWFPGHMKKALNNVEEKLKIVDVVIELLDARAPSSSLNPFLESAIKNKKRLYVFTKNDLADEEVTKKWLNSYKDCKSQVISLNITNSNARKILISEVLKMGEEKHRKEIAKGMKPQPIKAMIIGIPNVGKSSLVNLLAKRNAAGVQNKPGYTKGDQFIKVDKDFILLDTPGILPMNYEDKNVATILALLGSIKEDILPNNYLCSYLLDFLKKHYPSSLDERFGISEITSVEETLEKIATRRGLISGGEPDIEKAEIVLLKEFKDGKLGRISLELK